jgi:hypothetical protein
MVLSLVIFASFLLIVRLQFKLSANTLDRNVIRTDTECKNGIQLRKAGGESGIGHHAVNIGITNTCKNSIHLSGYPEVELIAEDGSSAGFNMIKSPTTFFLKTASTEPVEIKPGREGFFQLEFPSAAVDKKCTPVSKMRVKLPGIDSSFVLNIQMKLCGEAVHVSSFRSSVSTRN